MPDYDIVLTETVPGRLVGELGRRLLFVSEDIVDFQLISSGADEAVSGVRVTTLDPVSPEVLRRKLDRLVATEVLPQRALVPRRVWRSPCRPTVRDGVFEAMLAHGIVSPSGAGQLAFRSPFSDLLEHLDRRFRDVAVRALGAEERLYPSLIPTAVLARCGYLTAFPQLLLFVERLHGDLDAYEAFVGRLGGTLGGAGEADETVATVAEVLVEEGKHSGYTLTPAVCFHAYQQYAGLQLSSPPVVLTAKGTCYRHESRYHRSLERLWEFTVRELLVMGGRDEAAEWRRLVMDEAYRVVEELGLSGHCESASDPFFASARAADKGWHQRAMELKYELVLPVGGGRSVAAASFNLHGQSFGRAFGITLPGGEVAYTACAGFGLERLAFAFLCQHGLEVDGWPEPVRRSLVATADRQRQPPYAGWSPSYRDGG